MEYTSLTISGDTGVGKTRCTWLTVPKPCLVFQCEPTSFSSIPEATDEKYLIKTAVEADPVQPIDDAIMKVLSSVSDLKPKTIMWDGFGYWTAAVLDWHMENFKARKAKSPEHREAGRMVPQMDDYDAVANRTRRINRKLAQTKCHVIYTAHIKKNIQLDKDDRDPQDEYSPEIVGQSRSNVIKTASEFSCIMQFPPTGAPRWDFSSMYRLLHKHRVPLPRDEKLKMKRYEPNYAAFLNLALRGRGWEQKRINAELAEQYGGMEELTRVAKLKYNDMIES